jgi:hypothetical protein
MLKKFVMVLVLASLVAGGAFAQDSVWNNSFNINSGPTPQKGVLFVDLGYMLAYGLLGGFGIGAGWESRINDTSTWLINGGIGIYGNDSLFGGYRYSAFDFSVEANYRYYIFKSALDKLFLNVGLGYGGESWSYTYDPPFQSLNKAYSWGSLNIPLYAGWKAIIGPGFVVEVDLGWRIGVRLINPPDYPSAYSTPSNGGFLFGLRFGWAF